MKLLILAIVLLLLAAPPGAGGDLDRQEDLSEELATSMLEMADAIGAGKDEAVASWLAPGFRGEMADAAQSKPRRVHDGFFRWSAPVPAPVFESPLAWVGALRAHTREWTRTHDARVKVKGATFGPGERAPGEVTFLVRLQGAAGSERRSIACWLYANVEKWPSGWRWTGCRLKSFDEWRSPEPPFEDVTAAAGLAVEPRWLEDWPGVFGTGAAALDANGDGRLDLFVLSTPVARLYLNGGDGTFREEAGAWGLSGVKGGRGVVAFDADNDGRQDLFIGGRLWRNSGGRFQELGHLSHAIPDLAVASLAAADYDGDGLVDVYVCRTQDRGKSRPSFTFQDSNALPNLLYRNLGAGRFEEVAAAAGVADTGWSEAAAWGDYDDDGRPDLFVANDHGDKRLYHNEGGGRFRDVTRELGVLDTGAGMCVSWGDYDGDGKLDAYFSNMSSTAGGRIMARLYPGAGRDQRLPKLAGGNTLLRGSGGSFADVTPAAGVADGEWAWGNLFCDVDSDGWLDLLVTNGFVTGKSKKDT